MALERRYQKGPLRKDTAEPGLIQKPDDSVWIVNPDGSEEQITGVSGGTGAPSGPAGGVLGGNYPNPAFAVDMATQAELNAAIAGVARPFGWFDAVADYGVPNNGARADLAIQAAIDDMETMVDGSQYFGAPPLIFPPGRYSIRDTIQWRSSQLIGSYVYTGSQLAWDGAAGGTMIERYPGATSGGMSYNRLANFLLTEGTSRPATFVDLTTGVDVGSVDKFGQMEYLHFLGCSSDAIKVAYWVNCHWNDLRWDSVGGFAILLHVTSTFLDFMSFHLNRFTYDNNGGAPYGQGFMLIDNTDGAANCGVVKIENARVEMNRDWTGNKAFVEIKGDVASRCVKLHLSDIALAGHGSGNSILYSNSANPAMSHSLKMTNVESETFTNVCGGTWWSGLALPEMTGYWQELNFNPGGISAAPLNVGRPGIYAFPGSPEGLQEATRASLWLDESPGGAPWFKTTDSGSTGWLKMLLEYTFGKTAISGGLDHTIAADYEQACRYTLSEPGTVTSMRIYLKWNGAAGTQKLKLAIWSDNAGAPDVLKATTVEKTLDETLIEDWVSFAILTPVSLPPAPYWLGFAADATSNKLIYPHDSVANARKFRNVSYASLPTDPFGTPDGTDNDEISIYCVYTPG